MSRIAMVTSLALCAAAGAPARSQAAAPEAYTLKATGRIGDVETALTIVRDGARERIDLKVGPGVMASLYDFAAKRVYWVGWSGPGTCSSGRYLSARAPVDQDPVTGAADQLAKLTEGRSRKAAGAGAVSGLAARIETFVGGKRPSGRAAEDPWPTRVWLAEPGGYLLKLEAEGKGGKPVIPFEVTQLTFGKPVGAALEPPAGCTATNSEMDDAGSIRASGSMSATAEVSGAAEAGAAKQRSTGALAKIDALTLSVVPTPYDGPCGTKLQLTANVAVDGPATFTYGFRSSVGGLRFEDGENGQVTVDAAGGATLLKAVQLGRSLKGTVKLQATVQGPNGHNGPMKVSAPVPFDVTCK